MVTVMLAFLVSLYKDTAALLLQVSQDPSPLSLCILSVCLFLPPPPLHIWSTAQRAPGSLCLILYRPLRSDCSALDPGCVAAQVQWPWGHGQMEPRIKSGAISSTHALSTVTFSHRPLEPYFILLFIVFYTLRYFIVYFWCQGSQYDETFALSLSTSLLLYP